MAIGWWLWWKMRREGWSASSGNDFLEWWRADPIFVVVWIINAFRTGHLDGYIVPEHLMKEAVYAMGTHATLESRQEHLVTQNQTSIVHALPVLPMFRRGEYAQA
jgi:hypothetical protein